MSPHEEDAIRQVLDRLDHAAQIEAERNLLAALAAHFAVEDVDEPFDPTPEDWKSYEDWLERLEYERDCRMRFA